MILNKYVYELKNVNTGKSIIVKEIHGPLTKVKASSKGLGGYGEDRLERSRLTEESTYEHISFERHQISKDSMLGKVLLRLESDDNNQDEIEYCNEQGKKIKHFIVNKKIRIE